MRFKAATDRLIESVTLAQLAADMGVAENTILRARMDHDSPNARHAPEGWEGAVAKLARDHAARLLELANALERAARVSE